MNDRVPAAVLDALEVAVRDRIVHLGCGDGAWTQKLASLAGEGLAVGIDGSEEAVRNARRRWVKTDNVMFVTGSAEEIPWRDGFFTKAVMLRAAGADANRAAREVFRVLGPGGRAFVVAPAPGAAALFEAAGFDPVAVREIPGEAVKLLAATKPGGPAKPGPRSPLPILR